MYTARLEMAIREHIVGVRVPLVMWVTPGYAEDLADIFKSYSIGVWNVPETKVVLREEARFMSELNIHLHDLTNIVKGEWEKV